LIKEKGRGRRMRHSIGFALRIEGSECSRHKVGFSKLSKTHLYAAELVSIATDLEELQKCKNG